MKIDTEKSTPKYLQLKDILKRHFKEEHYQAGQQLLSENELMAQFDVSRSTVRQTLAELSNEGVIYKKQGLGSFFSGKLNEDHQPSFLIGVITPILFEYIYPQIIQGINKIAHQRKYNIVLASSEGNAENELSHIEQLVARDIDGLLFERAGSPQNFNETKVFQALRGLSIPVVLMDWAFEEPDVSFVSLDDVEGGFRAAKYLLDAGHRRIAMVSMEHHVPSSKRYAGYRKALEMYGIAPNPLYEKSRSIYRWIDADYAYTLTRELVSLNADQRPTAIFYFNDRAALRGAAAIRDAGLLVPHDISVMGFDDAQEASLAEVPLTTVVHPKSQIGKWAAEMLFDQILNHGLNTPHQMLLHPSIVTRASVKSLA